MSYRKLLDKDIPIQFKLGTEARINLLATRNIAVQGEPHFTTDTLALYVFDGDENMRVHGLDLAMIHNGDVMTHEGKIVWGI